MVKLEQLFGNKYILSAFYYYYVDGKTGNWIPHGLVNSYYGVGIGYRYHRERKGFWLEKKSWL